MESDIICISSEDESDKEIQPRKIVKKSRISWTEVEKSNKFPTFKLKNNGLSQVNKTNHTDKINYDNEKSKSSSKSNGYRESEIIRKTNKTQLNVSQISESPIFKSGEVSLSKRKIQANGNFEIDKTENKRIKLSTSITSPSTSKTSLITHELTQKNNPSSPEIDRASSPTPGCSWFPDVEKPKLIIKEKKILYDDEFDLFSTFIETCFKRDSSDDMKEIVKKLKKRHERLNPSFLNSDGFKQLLIDKQKSIDVSDEKLFVHIAEINDEMKQAAKQSRSNEKVWKVESKKEEVDVEEKSEIKDPLSKYEDRRVRKRIKLILKNIEICKKKIKQLEEQEVDLNDDDSSSYLIEDRFKRKLVQLWAAYCKYSGEKVDAGRVYLRPKYITTTSIPQVDQAIMNFINSKIKSRNELLKKGKSIADTIIFPDYLDILNCISKCNEQNNLGFNKAQQEIKAKEAFVKIGEHLQRVRQDDYWDTFSLLLEDEDDDPALKDNELSEKLSRNKAEGKRKMNNMFEEFCKKQESRPVEQNNDEDENDDDDEKDDDEEEDENEADNEADESENDKEKDTNKKQSEIEEIEFEKLDTSDNKKAAKEDTINEENTSTEKVDSRNEEKEGDGEREKENSLKEKEENNEKENRESGQKERRDSSHKENDEYNKLESEEDNSKDKDFSQKKKIDNSCQDTVHIDESSSIKITVKDSFPSTNQSGEIDSLPINTPAEVQDSSLGDSDVIDIDEEGGNADKQPLLRLRSFAKQPTSWKDSQGEGSPQFKKLVALTAKPSVPPVIRKFITSTPKLSSVKSAMIKSPLKSPIVRSPIAKTSPAVVDLTSDKRDSSIIKSPRKPLDPATLSALKNKFKTVMIPSNFKGKQIISVKNITNNYNVVNGSGKSEIIPARVLTSVSHKVPDIGSQTIIRIPAQNAAHLKARNAVPVKIIPKPGGSKQIIYQSNPNSKMINPVGKIVKMKAIPNSDNKVMKVLNLNETQKVSITALQKRTVQKISANVNPNQGNDLQFRQVANNPRVDHQYSKKIVNNVLRILKPNEQTHQIDPNKLIRKT